MSGKDKRYLKHGNDWAIAAYLPTVALKQNLFKHVALSPPPIQIHFVAHLILNRAHDENKRIYTVQPLHFDHLTMFLPILLRGKVFSLRVWLVRLCDSHQ